jgi:hypothetical protein
VFAQFVIINAISRVIGKSERATLDRPRLFEKRGERGEDRVYIARDCDDNAIDLGKTKLFKRLAGGGHFTALTLTLTIRHPSLLRQYHLSPVLRTNAERQERCPGFHDSNKKPHSGFHGIHTISGLIFGFFVVISSSPVSISYIARERMPLKHTAKYLSAETP